MNITIETLNSTKSLDLQLNHLLVVGFAGKDIDKTMEHIRELEEEGIKCPKSVPVLYQCSKELLTTSDNIEVIGNKTSGEVEYLILVHEGNYYIGVGSDHTDRELEAVSIHKSKQLCLKPFATTFWPYEEIKNHFDNIKLKSTQILNGQTIDYQQGLTSDLLSLDTIINTLKKEIDIENSLIFTGTVPLKNGFQYGEAFSCQLIDEKLNRTINLNYKIQIINEH
ncbi:DUF2848 family protein [Veillonella sp. R32]|uniref:DUF2848 family protein n=1 Tax=Veillonella sp. R32 TaxID=2021312 RepID=UPI0013894B88|nr:DUF2848 family protein [Veillonella sp. R32]KAF1683616.1 hypothetical protein VER_01560 [Veillonella sp. R32]